MILNSLGAVEEETEEKVIVLPYHPTLTLPPSLSSIAVLRRVKEECRKVAFDFDACQAQENDPSKCIEVLKALHACAERVKAENTTAFAGKQSSGPRGKDQA